jgi:UDP-N-acetylmuramate dehydrogenase
MDRVLKSYLEYLCGRGNVAENVPLCQKTTFKIGGEARFYVDVPTKESMMRLIGTLRYIEYPYYIIGMGANVLAPDEGFAGVVIHPAFDEIADNQCFIYADAGVPLRKLCNYARDKGLGGLEFAAGIPATVGGAVFMNAGAHGGQMSDVVAMADVWADGELRTLDTKKLKFAHRSSIFHKHRDYVILGVYFFLHSRDKAEIEAAEKVYMEKRRATQPIEPSAGSVFKRPHPAHDGTEAFIPAKAIDELGLKGLTVGGARVSEKHAGFIINTGTATAADVKKLAAIIKRRVKEKYGVKLDLEIQLINVKCQIKGRCAPINIM